MMERGFRASMLWLHTWSGLVMGWLLFAVFLTGTIVFFRTEINYWMTPELHQSVPAEDSALVGLRHLVDVAPNADSWQVTLPDDRNRVLQLRWQNPGQAGGRRGPSATLDATTGSVLHARETAGADFLYIFHFELYSMPRSVGRALVGIASMLMLVAILTGIVIHKQIFKDFFAFRTSKAQRGLLDAHGFTAVFALPFHLMITFSGLVLLAGTLVFWNNEPRQFRGSSQAEENFVATGPPAGYVLPPIQNILAQAEEIWGQPASAFNISNPLQEDTEIRVSPAFGDRFSNGRGGGRQLLFDGSGELLQAVATREAENGISAVYNSLVILHQARFSSPLLRWLFFAAGVLGTVMVGTGMVFWTKKRKKKQLGKFGYELVSALNVGAIAGLCVATAAFFWANRLLPVQLAHRDSWEINVFFLVWLLTFIHGAFRRHSKGWSQQFMVAAILLLLMPLLDSLTSSVSVLAAVLTGDWNRMAFDLVCVLFGAVFCVTAVSLSQSSPVFKPWQRIRPLQAAGKPLEVET